MATKKKRWHLVSLFLVLLLLPGCADQWTGVISGGGCSSFSIDLTVDKDGVIAGKATDGSRGVLWDVGGTVDQSGSVYLRMELDDPQHEKLLAQGYTPWMVLTGHLSGPRLSIAQPTSGHCDPPRSGVLKRG